MWNRRYHPRMGAGKIVWINGSFGAGKSTVALELTESWPGAVLFDPELVGILLRTVVPHDLQTEVYQGHGSGRELRSTDAWQCWTIPALLGMSRLTVDLLRT